MRFGKSMLPLMRDEHIPVSDLTRLYLAINIVYNTLLRKKKLF